jgi:hypothetical protein
MRRSRRLPRHPARPLDAVTANLVRPFAAGSCRSSETGSAAPMRKRRSAISACVPGVGGAKIRKPSRRVGAYINQPLPGPCP